MTNEEYIAKMNEICSALAMAWVGATLVTDEDLGAMEEMVEAAGMTLMESPLAFSKTYFTPDQQRAALKLNRDIRAFMMSFETG